jgi:hypothetical protein
VDPARASRNWRSCATDGWTSGRLESSTISSSRDARPSGFFTELLVLYWGRPQRPSPLSTGPSLSSTRINLDLHTRLRRHSSHACQRSSARSLMDCCCVTVEGRGRRFLAVCLAVRAIKEVATYKTEPHTPHPDAPDFGTAVATGSCRLPPPIGPRSSFANQVIPLPDSPAPAYPSLSKGAPLDTHLPRPLQKKNKRRQLIKPGGLFHRL